METWNNGMPEGLTTAGAQKLLEKYGRNELTPQKKESFFKKALHVMAEPMFLLLMIASVIYFILGEPRDGAVMLLFVTCMITIDVAQEWKTDRTLRALRDLSAPRVTVIRDGVRQEIASAELVPGDIMVLCEGIKIPADGSIVSCSDFCVDESTLTGEPVRVRNRRAAKATGNTISATQAPWLYREMLMFWWKRQVRPRNTERREATFWKRKR